VRASREGGVFGMESSFRFSVAKTKVVFFSQRKIIQGQIQLKLMKEI